MVGRAKTIQAPGGTGQGDVFEGTAFAPPVVPNPFEIMVSQEVGPGQFGGQKSAEAEESGLNMEHFDRGRGQGGAEAGLGR